MFAGLQRRHPQWQNADRSRRLENSAAGLAAALRGMGQGAQPFLGESLDGLTVPLLAIAGGDDPRYRDHAEAMVSAVPDGALAIVLDAGHAVIAEMPGEIASLVGDFIGLPS